MWYVRLALPSGKRKLSLRPDAMQVLFLTFSDPRCVFRRVNQGATELMQPLVLCFCVSDMTQHLLGIPRVFFNPYAVPSIKSVQLFPFPKIGEGLLNSTYWPSYCIGLYISRGWETGEFPSCGNPTALLAHCLQKRSVNTMCKVSFRPFYTYTSFYAYKSQHMKVMKTMMYTNPVTVFSLPLFFS